MTRSAKPRRSCADACWFSARQAWSSGFMIGLVMLAQMFARTVKASFHRGDTGGKDFGNLGVAAAFLHERQQRAILGAQLRERVTQCIEFLGINGPSRLGN